MFVKQSTVPTTNPKHKNLYLAIILAITFFSYYPVLNNGFTNWDDDVHFIENVDVRSLAPENIKAIFSHTVEEVYIPLTILSFAVEYHFFKYRPIIYHLDNLLLHLIVTALIFIFALDLGLSLPAAFCGGLLFGIHPIHVESVAWMTERKDVLYAAFYMLALSSYLQYLNGRKGFYWLSILCGILSVLSKPMALSLPLVFWICDWLRQRKLSKDVFLDKIPHFIYMIPIVWITYRLHVRVPGSGNILSSALTWIWSLTFYLKKFIAPFTLVPLYQLPKPVNLLNPHYFLAGITFIVIIFCLIRYRKNKWIIFAFLFYFISVFFLLRFDDLLDKSIVADRFMYLPSLGFCLLLGVGVDVLLRKFAVKRMVIIISGVILFGLLSFKTFQQSQIWRDGFSLWNYVLTKDANNSIAYNNRGNIYNENGVYDLALADYQKALAINPNYAEAYNNRGALHFFEKSYQAAFDDFSKAIAIDPTYADAYSNRGNIYSQNGQFDLAIKEFDETIKLKPLLWKAYVNRGSIYKVQKKYPLALSDYNKALEISPNYVDGYYDRGEIYMSLNNYDAAINDFSRALQLAPKYSGAYLNRSIAYGLKRLYKESLLDALTARALGDSVNETYIKELQELIKK